MDLFKAFGIYKRDIMEDKYFGNPETWYEGRADTPPHPRHGIFDQGWGSIPESRGTLVSEPVRNLDTAEERGLKYLQFFVLESAKYLLFLHVPPL